MYDSASGAAPSLWRLDPAVHFLNHGSFGACPRPVLEAQQRIQREMEYEPVHFFVRQLEGRLDAARSELARFIRADSAGLAFVPNATAGVNAVLRSLDFAPGDELLTTNQGYGACRNALSYVASRAGARVVVAELPFPIRDSDEAFSAVIKRVTSRTRLALLDHVTSPTALVMPIGEWVSALEKLGIDSLVDGAHAPGMLDLNVDSLGAAYYAGNCHKWVCAPKGAGFLYVRADRRSGIHPLSISHGATSPRTDRSRYHLEFDWSGTDDPSPYLCVPDAIQFMGSLLPGGWPELMARNHALAIAGRDVLCEALELPPPAPDQMLGSMASLSIKNGLPEPPSSSLYGDPVQLQILEKFHLEVPLVPWPAPPQRLVRISAQIYNRLDQYRLLASCLRQLLGTSQAWR
jgi:isopenicillin-N epimerase